MLEEIVGLLVLADLTESDGTGPVAVGLLDATGTRGLLGGSLLGGSLLGNHDGLGINVSASVVPR